MYSADDLIDYDDFMEENTCCPLGYDCLSMTGESLEDCPNFFECKTWAATNIGWRIPVYTHTTYRTGKETEITTVDFDDILNPLVFAQFPEETLSNVVLDLNTAGYYEALPIPYRCYKEFEVGDGKMIPAIFVDNFWVNILDKPRRYGQLLVAGFCPAVPLVYEGFDDGRRGLVVTRSKPSVGFIKAQSIYDRAGVAYDPLNLAP